MWRNGNSNRTGKTGAPNMGSAMQQDDMINKASKHLGKSPEELKSAMQNLSPQQAEQLNRALSDEEYAKQLLSSPQAQALIKLFSNGK